MTQEVRLKDACEWLSFAGFSDPRLIREFGVAILRVKDEQGRTRSFSFDTLAKLTGEWLDQDGLSLPGISTLTKHGTMAVNGKEINENPAREEL